MRTYNELIKLNTFEERLKYLSLNGNVSEETFGFDRYLNQKFYSSPEWKHIRDLVITRDCGYDMALDGFNIGGRIIVHHMNPIDVNDIIHQSDYLIDPNYLISVSHKTHNLIHYGVKDDFDTVLVERRPNDTCPWK